MPSATRSLIMRELLWLLGILAVALPLMMVLHALVQQVPTLRDSLRAVLGRRYVGATLYVLVVTSSYLGRLGAYGVGRLVRAIPLEARPA